VGTATVSIEPGNALFSVTLAGYGAPADGRFSLEWEQQGSNANAITWMCGMGKTLYGVDSAGTLYRLDNGAWKDIPTANAPADPVKFITAYDRRLIAVTAAGTWLTADPDRSSLDWQPVESTLTNIAGLCATDRHLYAATTDDRLYEGTRSGNRLAWVNIGSAQMIIGMAAHGNRLLALTGNQLLWRRNAEQRDILWTRIGYNNGFTYDRNIRQIAVANDRLYAIGADNRLYINRHATNNNLSARAMAIRKGDKTAVIAGIDVTGFDRSFTDAVKAEVWKQCGIPAAAILLNASHTHFAPVTQGWYTWIEPNQYPDSIYLNDVVKPGIVRAVTDAVARIAPANLYFGTTTSVIGGNRCLGGADALYDPTVDFIKVEDQQGTPQNVLFLAGCHPVFRNAGAEAYTLNANFPAVARQTIESRTGTRDALFLQACAGDINPLYEDYRKMGNILAEDVISALGGQTDTLKGNISYALDSVVIPVTPWTPAQIEAFRADNATRPGDLGSDKNVRWADIMLAKYSAGTMPRSMPIYVQTLNIGNWKLIGLSREVVTQYGIEIRKIWEPTAANAASANANATSANANAAFANAAPQHVSVIGYTNDVPSYLPAAPHIHAGTYEGYDSFFWYAQPGFFPDTILDTVVETIRKNNR
jgi:hypothetical protein